MVSFIRLDSPYFRNFTCNLNVHNAFLITRVSHFLWKMNNQQHLLTDEASH